MSITLRFSVATFIGKDATVSVLGSVPELGSWTESKAIPLKRSDSEVLLLSGLEPTFWYKDIQLSFNNSKTLRFEYKFVRKKGAAFEWEGEGPVHNRRQILNLDDNTSSELLVDGVYYLPVGLWIEKYGQDDEYQHTIRYFSHVCQRDILHTSKIFDNMWVGSCPRKRSHVLELKSYGITAVINLQTAQDINAHCSGFYRGLEDLPRALRIVYKEEGLPYIWCPVEDNSSVARAEMLPQVVYLLHGLLKGGHTVYVHCNGGVGRSVAVVAGYMMYVLRWSPAKLRFHLTSRRPVSYIDERALLTAGKDFQQKFGISHVSDNK